MQKWEISLRISTWLQQHFSVFTSFSQFRTLMLTSECLFSLINGDDMFATFSTMSDRNTVVTYFAKIYLYLFVCVFIYVVLSLFISIIMDHYEIVKVS